MAVSKDQQWYVFQRERLDVDAWYSHEKPNPRCVYLSGCVVFPMLIIPRTIPQETRKTYPPFYVQLVPELCPLLAYYFPCPADTRATTFPSEKKLSNTPIPDLITGFWAF